MYNGGKIFIGVIIFIVLFSAPFWVNFLSGDNKIDKPDLVYPEGETECVMPTDYMTTNHMDLLNEWRDKVVREDQRYLMEDGKVVMIKGKPAEMSLTHTCMACHSQKAEFCDACHNYLDVNPYCWDCHVAPEESKELTFKEEGSNE